MYTKAGGFHKLSLDLHLVYFLVSSMLGTQQQQPDCSSGAVYTSGNEIQPVNREEAQTEKEERTEVDSFQETVSLSLENLFTAFACTQNVGNLYNTGY